MSDMPAVERFSLVSALRDLGKRETHLDASIVTTYAFNGAFYEEVLLRFFERAGSRLNIVLVDARQLAETLKDPILQPRRAGKDYLLIPVQHESAFHPKLLVLLSEKRSVLSLGSHNATDAGFTHNEEMTVHWGQGGANAPAAILQPCVEYAIRWMERSNAIGGSLMQETSRRLRELAKAGSATGIKESALLVDGDSSLWTQLKKFTGKAKRAFVISPYFDPELALLHRLADELQPKEIIVGIDPEQVLLEGASEAPTPVRFVDVRHVIDALAREGRLTPQVSALNEDKKARERGAGFAHAKAIAFESDSGLFVSVGSANATAAAWLRGRQGNAEANILLTGRSAERAFARLGLDLLSAAPNIPENKLAEIANRSSAERLAKTTTNGKQSSVPVFTGRADEQGLLVHGLAADRCRTLKKLDGQDWSSPVQFSSVDGGTQVLIGPTEDTILEVHDEAKQIAFVVVNNEQRIRSATSSRASTQLLSSLGRIDLYQGFDEVFALISKHILDEAPQSPNTSLPGTRSASDTAEAAGEGDEPYGPRGISITPDSAKLPRGKLFEHGLVSELIAAIIKSLYVAPRIDTDGDAPNRDAEDAEEGETNADQLAQNVDTVAIPIDVDWPRLVIACRKRVGVMINRLKIKFADLAEPNADWELGRLLTVMCFVQKLRMLSPPPGAENVAAFPDSLVSAAQLRGLFNFAMLHVYGHGKLAQRLSAAGAAHVEERKLLDCELMWLARELNADCESVPEFNESNDRKGARLQDQADLALVSMSSAANPVSEQWLINRDDILARWSDSQRPSADWFERHRYIGQQLQKARRLEINLIMSPLRSGGFTFWRNEPGIPRVISTIAPGKALLIEPGGAKKGKKTSPTKVSTNFLVGFALPSSRTRELVK